MSATKIDKVNQLLNEIEAETDTDTGPRWALGSVMHTI